MSFIKYVMIIALLIMPISINAGYVSEHLAQGQFTTRVDNRAPVDGIKNLSTSFKKIYFFADVRDCKGCDMVHEWWYKGNKVSELETEIKSDRYRWWSSKTLTNNMTGKWTVKVFLDGDYEYSRSFTYFKPTKTQRKQTPVQERVKVQEAGECELQLRYFSDKVKSEPDDPYFKFMLKKWGDRCGI